MSTPQRPKPPSGSRRSSGSSSGEDTPESSGSEAPRSRPVARTPKTPPKAQPRLPRFQEEFDISRDDWSEEGQARKTQTGSGSRNVRVQSSDSDSTESSALTPSSDESGEPSPKPKHAVKSDNTPTTSREAAQVSSESESQDDPPVKTSARKATPQQRPVTPDSDSSEDDQPGPSRARRKSTMSSTSTPSQGRTPSATRKESPRPSRSGPSSRPPTRRPRARSSATDPDELDPPQQCCCCDLNCAACSSCASFLKEVPGWKIWGFMRRNSAYACAAGLCLGMLAVGLTGILDSWTFCSVGGYDLGAIGYCKDGSCTMRLVYNVDIGMNGMSKSTYILSGLLLSFTLIGTATVSYFTLIVLSQWCCQGQINCSCPSPRSLIRCIFCCSSSTPQPDAEKQKREMRDKKMDRRAMKDNRLTPQSWESVSKAERERMKVVAKNKNMFEMAVFLVMLFGAAVSVGCYAWMQVVNAQETFASDLSIYGLAIISIALIITSQIYRTTVSGAARAKQSQKKYIAQQYAKRVKAQTKARAAHFGKETKEVGASAVSKVKEVANGQPRRRRR